MWFPPQKIVFTLKKHFFSCDFTHYPQEFSSLTKHEKYSLPLYKQDNHEQRLLIYNNKGEWHIIPYTFIL